MSPSTPRFGSLYTLEKVWRIREALLLNITSHSGLGLRKQFLPRIIWSAPAIFFDFHSREIYRNLMVWRRVLPSTTVSSFCGRIWYKILLEAREIQVSLHKKARNNCDNHTLTKRMNDIFRKAKEINEPNNVAYIFLNKSKDLRNIYKIVSQVYKCIYRLSIYVSPNK